MTSAFDVLARIKANRAQAVSAPAIERCEMCAEGIGDEHSHVVNIAGRQLLCVCRPCYLLFTDQGADLRYRAVPDRYLEFREFALSPAQWDALEIPVGLAFFFRNSVQNRIVAFYPGPAGATESELPLQAWDEVAAADPRVRMLLPDVEAILIRMPGPDCYLLPIDACYEFVGRLRMLWRGFDGGQDVRAFMTEFFDRIARRSAVVSA